MTTNFKVLPALTIALMVTGCQSLYGPTAHVKAVDRLAQIHEEYGSITLSPPILIPPGENGKYFNFDLSEMGPKQYFEDAKNDLQGKSAVMNSTAEVSSVGVGLQANLDQVSVGKELWSQYFMQKNDYLRKKAAYESSQTAINNIKLEAAKKKLQLTLDDAKTKGSEAERVAAMDAAFAQFAQDIPKPQDPGSAPELPKLDNSSPPEIDKTLSDLPKAARDYLQAEKFAKQLDLIGGEAGSETKNRDRVAIITAAGDTTVEGIFQVLGEADKVMKFNDKSVTYSVAMVSVQPGWRTKHDFEANLTVLPKLSYQPAREGIVSDKAVTPKKARMFEGATSCEQLGQRSIPAAAAVSPMTDIQNLDGASSQRQAVEKAKRIGVALSFMGAKLGVSAFNDYVQKMESDIRTRTPMVPIAAYSNGGVFGYRVGPSVAALTQPGNPKSASGELLQKQTFPVLLIFGLDKQDVDVIRLQGGNTICEPVLTLVETPSWVPINEQAAVHRLSEVELVSLRDTMEYAPVRSKYETLKYKKRRLKELNKNETSSSKDSLINKLEGEITALETELQDAEPDERRVDSKLDKFYSFMYRDEDDHPQKTKHLITIHEESLRSLVFGAELTQAIPDSVFKQFGTLRKEEAPAIPEIEKTYVANIEPIPDDKENFKGRLVFSGKGLDQIDCSKAENIKSLPQQGTTGFKLTHFSCEGLIEADFEIGNEGGVVALRMPLKANKGAILTPPITIAALPTVQQANKEKSVSYSIDQNKGGAMTHKVQFRDVNEKELETSLNVLKSDLEKSKPYPPAPPASDKCCGSN